MSLGATPPPAPGGTKSALKVAVPLAALVGVVFGITYLAQYTPTTDDPQPKDGTTPGGPPSAEPPLRFFTSARRWDPPLLAAPGYRHLPLLAPSAVAPPDSAQAFPFSLQDRIFQGFYESDKEKLRATQFWFENRNPNPVVMQLKGVSCSACTGARLAAIPPETTRNLFQHAALSMLPLGAFNGYGVGLVQPAANLTQLSWTQTQFKDDQNATFQVPAAPAPPDRWAPQWGILELTFTVSDNPKLPLTADFATQVQGTGTPQTGGHRFVLMFDVAKPCELSRSVIDAGTLDPLDGDRPYEFLVYSNTRGPGSEFGDLAEPSSLVQAPSGVTDPVKFVEVTKVVRIPEADLAGVTEQLFLDQKRPSKVRAAYRVTVTVRPKVGETRMDLGLMERTVSLTVGTVTQQLLVKAMVRGAVWLDSDRTEVELKTFRGSMAHTEDVALTTEKTGVELTVVKDECKPSGFDFILEKQPDRGGQGHYRLKIAVGPNQVFGQIKGVVVLEVKGPNPQRIRIPFKGSATF